MRRFATTATRSCGPSCGFLVRSYVILVEVSRFNVLLRLISDELNLLNQTIEVEAARASAEAKVFRLKVAKARLHEEAVEQECVHAPVQYLACKH